jgi:hypothetical protein
VDQHDLNRAALAAAPDDPAPGPDDRLGHDRPPGWVEHAGQAVGHRALRCRRGRARRGARGEGDRRQSGSLRCPGSRLTSGCPSIRTAQSIAILLALAHRPRVPPATCCWWRVAA